jgi:hypothetical protein
MSEPVQALHTGTAQLDKLVPALLAAQMEFPTIGFDATNPHFRNRYATLAHIISETRPVLAKHGLVVSQVVDGDAVVTMLLHTSGQFLSGRTPIVSDKPGPQAMGSGITYARRYGLCAILGVAAEEDDDGEGAERRGSAAPKRPERARLVTPEEVAALEPEPPPDGEPEWFGETTGFGKKDHTKTLSIDGEKVPLARVTWRQLAGGKPGGGRQAWLVDTLEWARQSDNPGKVLKLFMERAVTVLGMYEAKAGRGGDQAF